MRIAGAKSHADAALSNRFRRMGDRLVTMRSQWMGEWTRAVSASTSTATMDTVEQEVMNRLCLDLDDCSGIITGLGRPTGLSPAPFFWNQFSGAEVALGALQEISRLEGILGGTGDLRSRACAIAEMLSKEA
jgi:hypothetical protein